jgi:branched-chain amino acid aminotransferase
MIQIKKCKPSPKLVFQRDPKFGTVFTPHFLKMSFSEKGPEAAEILPMGPIPMSPGSLVLHYGQSIFEGLKAYRTPDDGVSIFRLDLHAKRFFESSQRTAMAPFPAELFEQTVMEFVRFEKESVPSEADHSLYIRPLLFASDEQVKLGPSKNYTYLVMCTIAGQYFSTGEIRPAKVLMNRSFVRAVPGGTGEAKTAGNYAASLMPQSHAISLGADQVLYLDAINHKTIDELGGMNFFMVRGKDLITPKLNGCILNGVTRRSVLELAPSLGLNPIEREVVFDDLIKEIKSGVVSECFACGTAATVAPIGSFLIQEGLGSSVETFEFHSDFAVAKRILNKVSRIQRGQEAAPGKWLFSV